MTQNSTILVADDDPVIRAAICEYLQKHGHGVVEADSCAATLSMFAPGMLDAAVLDYEMPDGDSLSLLPRLLSADADVPIVILTGHGSIDLAVRAIQLGASNFLTKPIELPALEVVLERLLDTRGRQRRERADSVRAARRRVDPFLGECPAIRDLEEQARRLLDSDSTILIQGETGTGKGTLASWLHRNGHRSKGPYVSVNCAGLSHTLLESELFGHERGAFTGAVAAKAGLLEAAHQGTLVLDEVGDMDPTIQPKLLTVLEEQRFHRLGSLKEREVNVRLIAATNQDLQQLVRKKEFRSDLYFRIATLPLKVPSLRERQQDIPILARRILSSLGMEMGRRDLSLSDGAVQRLQRYSWPGNIRELRNVIERAILLCDADNLEAGDLRFDTAGEAPVAVLQGDATLEEVERRHIAAVLEREDGHVQRAATTLGIPRSTLYSKLAKYGLGAKGQRRQS